MASQEQYYRPADENKGDADSMRDETGQKAHETREKAGEMTESTKEKTKGTLHQTGEKVKQMAETTAQTVKHAFGAGQRNPNDPTHRAEDDCLAGAAAGEDVTGPTAGTRTDPKY